MHKHLVKQIPKTVSEGFTLIEVLVGILIATVFTLVAMQAVVLAAYFKVNAMETAEGTLIIQEDLEAVRSQSFAVEGTDADGNAVTDSTATECEPGATEADGYADTLRDQFIVSDATTASDSFTKSSSSFDNKTYTVSRDFTLSNEAPYDILQIQYTVEVPDDNPNNDDTVAELYTEVIPDAAFNCT